VSVRALAERAAAVFELSCAWWSGDGGRIVQRVGVLPGSGRGLLDAAGGRCEVLLTGDVGYHGADQAAERGLSVIDLPHGEFEWWAFRRWTERVVQDLTGSGVSLAISRAWRPPWERVGIGEARRPGLGSEEETVVREGGERITGSVRAWIDGGSRGNPGLSAIGVVIEDSNGVVVETVAKVIGVGTNNVAEYQALLTALERAHKMGAREVEVLSDSELLVRQILGEYKVKNEGLKPLHAEARDRAAGFRSFAIRHVDREQNVRADALVNRALDEQQKAGL
jgi:ribonuclease HI